LNGTPYSLLKMDESVSVLDLLAQTGEPFKSGEDTAGPPLDFTLNGSPRRVPGRPGRASILRIDGKEASSGSLASQRRVTYLPAEPGIPGSLKAADLQAEVGEIAFFLNGQPVVSKALVSVNGRPVSPETAILPGAVVETNRPTRLATSWKRMVLRDLRGDQPSDPHLGEWGPPLLTQRNYVLRVGGKEVGFEHPVADGEVVEFSRVSQSHFRVRDVVTPPKDGAPLRLRVNGRSFELKGEPGQIFRMASLF
jgi:hypothetical protein